MSTAGLHLSMCYGHEKNLPKQLNLGRIYFTTDTYKMFIDLPNGRILISTGVPVPVYSNDIRSIYPNEASNSYANFQDSSSFLPGYQEIKEY